MIERERERKREKIYARVTEWRSPGPGLEAIQPDALPLRRTLAADRCEQRRAEIAVAAVRKDHDDRAVLHLLRLFHRRPHGRSAAHADEQAFLERQPARGVEGVIVHDVPLLIQR